MPFGINKGYSLSEIYHYLPTYIEFLIIYIEPFEIDVAEFHRLPKPVRYQKKIRENATEIERILSLGVRLHHKGSIEVIKKAQDLIEYDYRFPEKIKLILHQKSRGQYVAPRWEPQKVITSLPITELLLFLNHLQE